MKKTRVKHPFNMVEIALALAIIAIGIGSILVLFPVGVNASKGAVADNNLVDVGEYMIAYLRAGYDADWRKGSDTTTFSGGIASKYSDLAGIAEDPIDEADWESDSNNNLTRLRRLKDSKIAANKKNSVFLFQQVTKLSDDADDEITDFSAVIKIWKEDVAMFAPEVDSGSSNGVSYAKLDGSSVNLGKYAAALCMELSWPAEAPADRREKRNFRYEIFNESFNIK